jgi:cell division protease FtsH
VVETQDFEAARDRVLMGQRRESLVLSDDEKERVAFHEGGHAVLAYVLPEADPVHKVTILPTGMALGVTQQLPVEERHIHPRSHIEDALAVRMGGRVAELLVYGDLSTGASNDLVGNTELARKMVREWGMSDQIGPMAWGSAGQVFLGEDLMHTRDYSEDTSRVIDAEVERILRDQEERALEVLSRHRGGLDAVARALLDEETIDGATVGKLVDTAYGKPVHEHGVKAIPPVFVAEQHGRPSGDSGSSGADPAAANGNADARGGSATNGDGSKAETEPGSEVESEVAGSSHASEQSGNGQPGGQQDNGQGSAQPWPPPPPPPPGHWPQAPAPWPAQPAPGHWPHQAPWPPPPPPPPSGRR